MAANQTHMKRLAIESLVAVVLLSSVVLFFFRGNYEDGMQNDEVSRVVPWVHLFNEGSYPADQSIYDITIAGHKIPLMFKNYMSSLAGLRQVPALIFFDDYRYGVRLLYKLYFIGNALALFFFLRRYRFSLALFVSGLYTIMPYFYPYARYGHTDSLPIMLLVLAAWLAERAVKRKRVWLWLPFGAVVGFGFNLHIFFVWPVAAMAIAGLLLYRKLIWQQVKKIWPPIWALLGFAIGDINMVIYNIANFGRTTEIISDSPDKMSLLERTWRAARQYFSVMTVQPSNLEYLFGGLALLTLVLYLAGLFRREIRKKYKVFYFCALAFVIEFAMIVVTPGAFRPGHWVYTTPLLELTIAGGIVIAVALVGGSKRRRAIVAGILALSFLGSALAGTTKAVREILVTKGTGNFSPGIYELHDLLEEREEPFVFVSLDWGFVAQTYFLSKGYIEFKNIYWQLNRQTTIDTADLIIAELVVTSEVAGKDNVFVYHSYNKVGPNREKFLDAMERFGAETQEIWSFTDYDRASHHAVVIENSREVAERLCERFADASNLAKHCKLLSETD